MFPRWYPAAIAWALVVMCWLWIFFSSRKRAALMRKLSAEFAGFTVSRFFLPTLSPEPVFLSFTRIKGGVPVRFGLRYEYPFRFGGAYPCTVFEFETQEAMFGSEGGAYSVRDYNAGQGLFLGGMNLTKEYAKFAAMTPHVGRFRLGWKGATAWLVVPGLLGEEAEVWVRHCMDFMEELAAKVCGPSAGRA